MHAVGGGKSGLLRTLIEDGVADGDNAEAVERLTSITEPAELVRFLVQVTRLRFAEWSGLMRQVAAAAPQDAGVRRSQEIAHEGLRGALRLTARRLAGMGALKEGVNADRAADLLWFYLSNTSYFLRTDELGWSLDESEAWLIETLTSALLARAHR